MPHRGTTSPSAAHAQNSAPSRDSGHAAAPQSLIDELEDAITKKNLRQRAAVMRRVTDLFILNGAGSSQQFYQVAAIHCRLRVAVLPTARAGRGATRNAAIGQK
jgi:hypothetical protein